MKSYMRKHTNCPYFDKGSEECKREGCLFTIPCEKINETYHKVFVRTKKRG